MERDRAAARLSEGQPPHPPYISWKYSPEDLTGCISKFVSLKVEAAIFFHVLSACLERANDQLLVDTVSQSRCRISRAFVESGTKKMKKRNIW